MTHQLLVLPINQCIHAGNGMYFNSLFILHKNKKLRKLASPKWVKGHRFANAYSYCKLQPNPWMCKNC